MRKDGTIPKPKNNDNSKIVEVLVFDENKEKELLNRYKSSENILIKHFVINELLYFYYKYRDLDDKYIQKCVDYCYVDIDSLNELQLFYEKEQDERIEKIS